MDKPSIGKSVHFVYSEGQHLPAVITSVSDEKLEIVNICIHWDPSLPKRYGHEGMVNCFHDEKKKEPNTWHWPERV